MDIKFEIKKTARRLVISWLGYLDSNQGITVSETVVLPLDYIPKAKEVYTFTLSLSNAWKLIIGEGL